MPILAAGILNLKEHPFQARQCFSLHTPVMAFLQADGSFVIRNPWIDFELKQGTTEFGLNLAPIYPADPPSPKTYTFALSTGQVLTSTATSQTYSQEFRGISSTAPINSVRIFIEAGPIYIEDFRYYVATALDVRKIIIDVRPDSAQNVVNPKAKGNLPVAILGSASLDVRTIDAASIRFGVTGEEQSVRNYNVYDANGDGFPDMVLDIDNGSTGVLPNTTKLRLAAKTTTGTLLAGEDSIRIIPKR